MGLLSLLTLLRGVERPGWRSWSLNFLVDVLLGMSHLFANLLFVAQAVFLLACHRRRKVLLPWAFSHAAVAAVVGAWLYTCDFVNMRSAMAGAFMPPLSWDGVADMLKALAGASYTWVGPIVGKSGVMGTVIITQFFAAIAMLVAERLVFRKASAPGADRHGSRHEMQGVFLLVLAIFVPPALLAVVTELSNHCFVPRYAICSAAAVPILMACVVTMLRTRALQIVLAATLMLTNVSLLNQTLCNRPQRFCWTGIARFLAREVKREDYFVAFSPPPSGFSGMIEMLLPVTPAKTVRKETWSQRDLEELAAWHARGVKVWCVTGIESRPAAEFETLLGAHGLPFSKHVFDNEDYVIYGIPAGASFMADGLSVSRVPLGAGDLRGWFGTQREHMQVLAGMTFLSSVEHPYAPIFAAPSLCPWTVLNNCPAGLMPSTDGGPPAKMDVRMPSTASVEARWPIWVSGDRLECRMRHTLSGKNAVDILFEVAPQGAGSHPAPLVFTWVSHVRGACGPAIHFPGVREGTEGWVSFGDNPGERGVVHGMQVPGQKGLAANGMAGPGPVEEVSFSEPVYYGLVDGDQNDATDSDMMAFILMFDRPEDTRFVLRDCEDNTRAVEWDWQFVIQPPEAGKACSRRARMVYKPFLGREDVLAEYRAWRDAPPSADGLVAGAHISPMSIPGPDGEEYEPLAPLHKLAELDPKRALDAYVGLLEIPLYCRAAADGIDACFMRFGDHGGLAEQWEAIGAGGKRGVLPWSRAGAARHRVGDWERAAADFARGLEMDPQDRECLLGLISVRVDQGDVGDALRLAAMIPSGDTELARQTGSLCAAAARSRSASNDPAKAEAACRAALRLAPGDVPSKLLLGRLLAGWGQIEEGLALFGEVIAANPGMIDRVAEACSAIAETCMKAGNAPGAAVALRRAIACSSDKPNYRMALGQALEAARDDGGALAEYTAAMAESPESQAFAARIDMLLERRGESALRGDVWRRLAEASPDAVVPRMHLSTALEDAGDLSGAETACQAVLQREPGHGTAKIQLGKLRAVRGDIEGGLVLMEEAVSARPELADLAAAACATAAKARLAAGDNTGAGVVLARARTSLAASACTDAAIRAGLLESLGDMVGAEAAYRDALKCDPGHVPAKIRLGALLVSRGNGGEGCALIEEAAKSGSGGPGEAAGACAEAAKRSMQSGDASGAVAALRMALSLTPDVLGYRADLAAALEAAGDSAAAFDEYRTVVDGAPESPKSSARMDAILDARGERAARVDLWRRMADGHPNAAVPRLHLGLALEASGDTAGARAALEETLKINPALAEARSALGRLDNAAGNGKR